MSICAVGESSLVEAFALFGVPGREPEPGRDLGEWLAELARREKISLMLVQNKFAVQLSESMVELLAHKQGCLVVPVPRPGEGAPDPETFRRAVREAIGVTP
jgi:vacuolar-type H+-ATPase subunit F/Vma7